MAGGWFRVGIPKIDKVLLAGCWPGRTKRDQRVARWMMKTELEWNRLPLRVKDTDVTAVGLALSVAENFYARRIDRPIEHVKNLDDGPVRPGIQMPVGLRMNR